jgi:hypothetical protein
MIDVSLTGTGLANPCFSRLFIAQIANVWLLVKRGRTTRNAQNVAFFTTRNATVWSNYTYGSLE